MACNDYFFFYFRRQWVREEDLAKDLKIHSKQLRRTLRLFEEEKLVTRDHRREVSTLIVNVYTFSYLSCLLFFLIDFFAKLAIEISIENLYQMT